MRLQGNPPEEVWVTLVKVGGLAAAGGVREGDELLAVNRQRLSGMDASGFAKSLGARPLFLTFKRHDDNEEDLGDTFTALATTADHGHLGMTVKGRRTRCTSSRSNRALGRRVSASGSATSSSRLPGGRSTR